MRKVTALSHTERTEIAESGFFPASLRERQRLAEQLFSEAASQGFGEKTRRPLRTLRDTTAAPRALVRRSPTPRDEAGLVRRSPECLRDEGGFTLIELLAVITIIAILAGISFGVFTFANRKAIDSRTRTEIKSLETAIEQYKLDKGFYPQAVSTPRTSLTQAMANSKLLFKALSGNSAGTSLVPDTGSRPYFIKFAEGKRGNLMQDGPVYYIVDPNRNPYNYISGDSSIQTNKVTFDLWSFGVDGTGDTYDDVANWKF